MNFDTILTEIGEFGRWQVYLFICFGIVGIVTGAHNLLHVFLAATPPHHRCKFPFLVSGILQDNLEFWIPKDRKGQYDKCSIYSKTTSDIHVLVNVSVYNKNYTEVFEAVDNCVEGTNFVLGSGLSTAEKNVSGNWSVVRCTEWDYGESWDVISIVTEWNLVCDREWMRALAQSIYMVGFLTGAVGCGALSDRFGRLRTLIGALAGGVVSGTAAAFAPEYWSFVFLRMLVGISAGGSFTIAFVVVMETIGIRHRMIPGVFVQGWFAIGFMIVPGIAYVVRDYFTLQLIISVPPILLLSYFWLVPESPRWLLSKGKLNAADRVIRRAAKMNGKKISESLVHEKTLEAEKDLENHGALEKNYTLLDLLRYPNMRKKSLNIFFNWFVNSLVYYGLSLGSGDLAGNMYINVFLSGAVEIPGYIIAVFVLDRIGRRWPLTGSLLIGGIACLLTIAVPKDMPYLTIIFTMLGKLAIAASFAIIYVFSAEQFPTVVRNVGVGAGSMCARVGSLIAPFVADLNKTSQSLPFIIFGVSSIIAGVLALFLPETLNHSLPETMSEGEEFGKYAKCTFRNLMACKQRNNDGNPDEPLSEEQVKMCKIRNEDNVDV